MINLLIAEILFLLIALSNNFSESVLYGWPATETMFPYQVSVRIDGEHVCGGVIISELYILTAGHCVEGQTPEHVTVHAGLIKLDDDVSIECEVHDIIRHERYVPQIKATDEELRNNIDGKNIYRPQNDIAILELSEGLNLDDEISKVDLPKSGVQPGQKCKLAGWSNNQILLDQSENSDSGSDSESDSEPAPKKRKIDIDQGGQSNYLTWTQLEVLDKSLCAKKSTPQRENEFCAEGFYDESTKKNSRGMAACPGDSGSPLVCNNVVYGIVSSSRCSIYFPTSFVDVYKHLDNFIYKHIKCL